MASKLEYIARSLSRTNKAYENYVINAIYAKLNNSNIEIVTQQYVFASGHRRLIDLYFPQIKVAVEVEEPYHKEENQRLRDKKRIEEINASILETTIIDTAEEIEFIPIPVTKDDKACNKNSANKKVNYELLSLEELNKKIDAAVKIIKTKMKTKGNPVWLYSQEAKSAEIIKRGYLVRGDTFNKKVDLLHVFGVEKKGFQPGEYKSEKSNLTIWFPRLYNGKSEDWKNTVSSDLTKIYEAGLDEKSKEKKSKENVKKDIAQKATRIVVLMYKDALGLSGRRFLGVYQATRYDKKKQAEVWTLVSTTQPLIEL